MALIHAIPHLPDCLKCASCFPQRLQPSSPATGLGTSGPSRASAASDAGARACKAGEVRWLERWDRSHAGKLPGARNDLPPARRRPVLTLAGRRHVRVLDGAPDRGRTSGPALPAHLVSRASAHLSERHAGLDPGGHDGDVPDPGPGRDRHLQSQALPYKGGRLVLQTPVAVGKSSTPTPRGRFYITQRFVLTPARPVRRQSARHLGILGRAQVVAGGWPGRHPRNQRAVLDRPPGLPRLRRLPERAMLDLFAQFPLATPVIIRN